MSIVNKFLEERKSNLEPGEERVLRQGAEMLQEMGMDMSRIIKQLDEGYLDNVSRDKVKEIINFMEDVTGPDDDRWDDVMTLKYKIKNHQLCEGMATSKNRLSEESSSHKYYDVNVNESYPIRMEDGDIYYLTEDDNCDRIILSKLPKNNDFDLMKDKIIHGLQMDIDEGLKSYPKCHLDTLASVCAYVLKASNDIKGRS